MEPRPTMSLQRGWGQVGGELSAVSDHVQVRQRQMNYCEDGGARLGWTTDSSVAGLAWLNEDDFGCYCLPGTRTQLAAQDYLVQIVLSLFTRVELGEVVLDGEDIEDEGPGG